MAFPRITPTRYRKVAPAPSEAGVRRTLESGRRLALVVDNKLDQPEDDLSRPVYCVLGLPLDAVEMEQALHTIAAAAETRRQLLLSTPNLNFVAHSRTSESFRESLLASDLCTADGMPVVWIARLLGIPIRNRVAGSDIFAELKFTRLPQQLSVFFFGGARSAAQSACHTLNATSRAQMTCAGCLNPGHGSVETMSETTIIDTINASGADILCVALGAAKGQAWLLHNHERIKVPVRAHLGAVLNFQAGTARRAPKPVRQLGFEWLWRIKEEPYLWRRYCRDGLLLLRLLACNVLPLAVLQRWRALTQRGKSTAFDIKQSSNGGAITLGLRGHAIARHVEVATPHFRTAAASTSHLIIDLSQVSAIDARFIGLLMMLRKLVRKQNARLQLIGASRSLSRLFHLHAAAYLLAEGQRV